MPASIKNKMFGDSNEGARPTHLTSHNNGLGLWVHQTASTSKINSENLPPIQKNGSIKGTPQSHTGKPPRNSLDLQAERGVVAMLEKKYQEAMQESDQAQIKCEKAVFEADILRRDKTDVQNRNQQLQFDLNKALQRLAILESSVIDKDEQLKEQYETLLE